MKYENFEKVQILVSQIKAIEESIHELKENVEYVIIQGNNEDYTVGLKENEDIILVELAKGYVNKVVQHYHTIINNLKTEIEQC